LKSDYSKLEIGQFKDGFFTGFGR